MKNLLCNLFGHKLVVSFRVFSAVKVEQCPLSKDAVSVGLKLFYLNLYVCAERPAAAGGGWYRWTVVSRGHLAVDSGLSCGKTAPVVKPTGGKAFEGRGHGLSM